jgi:tRNA dimethylallyltransferase
MIKYLAVIAGPTAAGKTQTAIEVARYFNTDIISADSRQIYRELKIGTAAPSAEQLAAVKHHFIGNRSVHEYYNASMFECEVIELLDQLFENHNIVVMTGGSGLYIDAVCKGIDDFPTVDPEIRVRLKSEYLQKGIEWLRQQVKTFDPDYYMQVDINNPKRLLKALEIYNMTGRSYSSFFTNQKKERNFEVIYIGLNMQRNMLYNNINNRVDHMVSQGLVDEAKKLLPLRNLNALNTVGYKEMFDYFEGKTTLNEAIDLIKRHTRQYARRQLTWFRKNKQMQWFEPHQKEDIINYIIEFQKGKNKDF